MKKAILKGIVFGITFFVAIIIISKVMNKGNNDLTTDMAKATLPVIYMGTGDVRYNELHGYVTPMDTAFMRDTITALDDKRTVNFIINTYGENITSVFFEVRSLDGERLIENTEVKEFQTDGEMLSAGITVKDLIEQNQEYELIFVVSTEKQDNIRYYTRVIWPENYHLTEKIEFAQEFTEKTFDKTAVQDLAIYMETNSEGDNSTLHNVDIHCNLSQVSWGKLSVQRVTEPVFNVTELAEQTASLQSNYVVSAGQGDDIKYFYVEEFYRVRYTAERMYLLDFERTMNSMLDEEDEIYVNDKIMIGVESENLPLVESEDGNVFAFEVQNKLYCYNVTTNKLSVVFGFYDKENADARTLHNQHSVKVLDIDEGGNIRFAVCGYMNRGRHEGEVGIQVYQYDSALNTVEEILYIPYDKPNQVLQAELERLMYLNREGYLYLVLDNVVYEINLLEKTCSKLVEVVADDGLAVSASHQMIVWQRGELYESGELVLMNLATRDKISIKANEGEYIMPLDFMGEDFIYGMARGGDVLVDAAGRTTFPMYAVCIRSTNGLILKTYRQENIYITECNLQNNQIMLTRMLKEEDGTYEETTPDYIMNSSEVVSGKNTVNAVVTENYGQYIQIAVKKEIDAKSIQILTPKEVLYEGNRNLVLQSENSQERYYVYGLDGVAGIFRNPASAIILAEAESGIVMSDTGEYVWLRGNRATRNQIMAIEGTSVTEEKDSLAVCLDVMLAYEGVIRNTETLLAKGQTPYEILEENLHDAQILNLEGCALDSTLYYVNQDIPVLATLQDGSAVLIVGFNEFNVVLMNPLKGTVYKMGKNDSTEWFADNGNHFITYIRE